MTDSNNRSPRDPVTWALTYAALGWHVFPCHSISRGACTCAKGSACSAAGKHPRTDHGWKDASTDPGAIRAWWGRWPEANVGIACGPSGLLVVDVDPRKGGADSMRSLTVELPMTLTATTGGAGKHLLFRKDGPVPNRNGWLPGVDVRADGGHIVVAPSEHLSGGRYQWDNWGQDVAVAPAGLVESIRQASSAGSTSDRYDGASRIPEGTRDDVLFREACRLRNLLSDRGQVEAVIAFLAQERCDPPMPMDEAMRKVDQAYAQERYEVEPWMIEWVRRHAMTATGSLFATVMELAAEAGTLTVENDRPAWEPVNVGALLDALDGDPEALDTDPPSILTRSDGACMFYAGQLNGLHGRSESGKSWVAIFAAAQELERGNPVLYLDFESDAKDVLGRLLIAGAKQDQIRERFVYVSPHTPYTQADVLGVAHMIVDGAFTLTVVDGVTDAMSLFGFDGRHEKEYSEFKNALLLPLCLAGSAVVTIDHVAEGSDGDKAIGTQHKRASVRGAALLVEVVKPFGRGRVGTARLTVAKDRRGWVRGSAERQTGGKDVAGLFVLDAAPALDFEQDRAAGLSFVLQSEWNAGASSDLARLSSETERRQDERVQTLVAAVAQDDGANTSQLATVLGWSNRGEVARVAQEAESMGLIQIRKNGPGRPTTHHVIQKEAE